MFLRGTVKGYNFKALLFVKNNYVLASLMLKITLMMHNVTLSFSVSASYALFFEEVELEETKTCYVNQRNRFMNNTHQR